MLAIFWTLYFTLHSLLATSWLKNAAARHLPGLFRFYRLAYNQTSVWLLLLIYHYQAQLPEVWLMPPNQLLFGVGIALLLGGVLLAVAALRGYDLGEFLGWAYVRRGADAAHTTLNTSSLNALVRHPLYLGLLLGLLGYLLLAPTTARATFVGCTLAYLLLGTRLEERKLVRQFGAAYLRYQARVPRLLPTSPRQWFR